LTGEGEGGGDKVLAIEPLAKVSKKYREKIFSAGAGEDWNRIFHLRSFRGLIEGSF
jgi:hypothetical protein